MMAPAHEILRYRTLIRFLATKRNRGSIRKTLLGKGWIVLMPLAQLLIYYFLIVVVFNRGTNQGFHPFILLMTGLIHYYFLQQVLSGSCAAILSSESLLLQIRIEPIVFTAVNLYQKLEHFLVALGLYAIFYLWLGPELTWNLVFYPALLLILLTLAWAWSVLLSSLTVFVRDLTQVASLGLRMMMYLCPVVYLVEWIPERHWGLPLREIYLYNPVSCLFALFQWSLLGAAMPSMGSIFFLCFFTFASLVGSHALYWQVRTKFTKAF